MWNKIKKGFQIFGLTWKILKPKQRVLFVLLFFALLILSVMETAAVSVLIPFIQAILTPESLLENKYLIWVFKCFHVETGTAVVIFVSTFIVFFYVLKNVYSLLCTFFQQKYRCYVQQDISVSLLQEYLKRPYSFFTSTNSSVLIRNIINDADGMMTCINSMFGFFSSFFMVVLFTAFLFITDPFIASGLFSAIIVALLIPTFILGSPIRKTGALLRDFAALVYKDAFQSVNGIKEIIVSNKQDFFSETYKKSYSRKSRNDVKSCVLNSIPARLIEVVCISALIIIVAKKALSGNASEEMVAQMGAFAVAAFKLLPSVSSISGSFNSLIQSYSVLTNVYANLNENYEHMLLIDSKEKLSFENQIHFNNVAFKYDTGNKFIFENVNLSINKGDVVGIVGPSGAGKTTFVDVLLGLLSANEGNITVDNVLLTNDNMSSWRALISYVPQTAYLLDDTIEANVAFGMKKDNVDVGKLNKALDDAMLSDYISSLPEKLETRVGERGVQMSGGQRQRLSIARALYSDPQIIIFDEATSALDEVTEREIMESIDNLIGSKTLIIIAHRLSTLKKCNKIIEVKDGKVFVQEESK